MPAGGQAKCGRHGGRVGTCVGCLVDERENLRAEVERLKESIKIELDLNAQWQSQSDAVDGDIQEQRKDNRELTKRVEKSEAENARLLEFVVTTRCECPDVIYGPEDVCDRCNALVTPEAPSANDQVQVVNDALALTGLDDYLERSPEDDQ